MLFDFQILIQFPFLAIIFEDPLKVSPDIIPYPVLNLLRDVFNFFLSDLALQFLQFLGNYMYTQKLHSVLQDDAEVSLELVKDDPLEGED